MRELQRDHAMVAGGPRPRARAATQSDSDVIFTLTNAPLITFTVALTSIVTDMSW